MKSRLRFSGSITVDLADVKAIRMEYGENSGGELVFDFNDMVITVVDPNSGDLKLQSFPNSSVKHYFDSTDSLQAYYDEWTEYWKKYKESL